MALTIGQIQAVSYNEVLSNSRKAENQWGEAAWLRELERQGAVIRKDFGAQLEETLDYQRNAGTVIQSTDLQPLNLSKTEVMTAAVWDIAEVVAPITWSRKDEVQNPTKNMKVNRATQLMENGIESHDDIVEQALLTTSTNGFLGVRTHVADDGQGSDGGIDAGVNTWWRNQQTTYVDDTDIESALTVLYNACAKGSGSRLVPTGAVSDGTTQALFEGTQQALQRWVDTDEMKAGFKVIAFKTVRWCFSKYGGTRVFFWNPKSFKVHVSKGHFRELDEIIPLENATGYTRRIYSAVQTTTNNRSRLGVAHL
jgi:hypothetical protein